MRRWIVIIMLWPTYVLAQEEDSEPKFTVGGYVKDMVTLNATGSDSLLVDNLVHNRVNLAWYPNKNFSVFVDFRNRIFTGDLVKAIPDYGNYIDVNNDYFDLSWMPANNQDLVIHTMIDRAYFRWTKEQWEVSVGRQRINWGMNLLWNSNDIFNSYSFFDFDYEERIGSDALRIRKYTGVASEIEFAIKAADSFEDLTSAFKYLVNKWNYDIQFIGGVMKNNLALGNGWAGNIKSAGFKGEMMYLQNFDTQESGYQLSVSFDYSFTNSLYLNGSAFYNSFGSTDPNSFLVTTSSNLDIRSLSPYKWSLFVQGMYPVHPLVNVGLSNMIFPSDGSLFVNPYVTLSVMPNLDLDLIGQLLWADNPINNDYGLVAKIFYFRLKYSY